MFAGCGCESRAAAVGDISFHELREPLDHIGIGRGEILRFAQVGGQVIEFAIADPEEDQLPG